jgi:hypothetical protein
MFLTNPTKDELNLLDLATLTEMLNTQTVVYTRLLNQEGLTARALAQKDLVINIQEAIEAGREKEKKSGLKRESTTRVQQSRQAE